MSATHNPHTDAAPVITFSTVRMGHRYSRHEVDEFIGQVEARVASAIAEGSQRNTAEQLRHLKFSEPQPMRRGYDCHEVDTFLRTLAEELNRENESPGELSG